MPSIIDNSLEHLVLPHIRWETMERILDEIGKRRYRIAYNNGDLEFMTLVLEHQRVARLIDRLIFFAAMETQTPLRSGGSTTLKNRACQVAIEPDACFWIKHEGKMRGKKEWISHRDPPPDLAVEVDVNWGCLNRVEIFAAMRVPEVWRFDSKVFRVLVLSATGKYRERNKSLAFPALPMDGFARFVRRLGSAEEVSLLREFTQWLRSDIVGKKLAGERKNGKR